jgi:hypothetical protein
MGDLLCVSINPPMPFFTRVKLVIAYGLEVRLSMELSYGRTKPLTLGSKNDEKKLAFVKKS